jgi:hypothetical protein
MIIDIDALPLMPLLIIDDIHDIIDYFHIIDYCRHCHYFIIAITLSLLFSY